MSAAICVFGLWHLGCVTAACLADQGFSVIGLDLDRSRVEALQAAQMPVAEPGLADLIVLGIERRKLRFTSDPAAALSSSDVMWITFDTPVDDGDRADLAWLTGQLEHVRPFLIPKMLVVVSSQVPLGFARNLEGRWRMTDPTLQFASAPENLRLGQAIEAFRAPARVVIGLGR